MITPQVYKRLIVSGIQDLPPDLLAEAANFIYFLRRKADNPDAFAEEQYALLLEGDTAQLDAHELDHLEAEINGYEQQYPRE